MSFELSRLAWRALIAAAPKIVLLALADATRDNDKRDCWLSVLDMSGRCGMAERTVQTHLAYLETRGYLKRFQRAGRRTRYHLTDPSGWPSMAVPNEAETPADFAPPQISHPRRSGAAPPQNSQDTPADFAPFYYKATSTRNSTNTLDRFDAFWIEYPRKVSKPAAQKAWRKISPNAELCETIMAGLRAQLPAMRAKDEQYIPHPSTWLNNERWNDPVSAKPSPVAHESAAGRAERLGNEALRRLGEDDRDDAELIEEMTRGRRLPETLESVEEFP